MPEHKKKRDIESVAQMISLRLQKPGPYLLCRHNSVVSVCLRVPGLGSSSEEDEPILSLDLCAASGGVT